MTASHLFAYDRSGNSIVIGAAEEILVHSGADESPRWRKPCRGILVAVGAVKDLVIALDENGRLTFFSSKEGEELESVDLNGIPRDFALASDGTCAVTLPDAVAIVRRGEGRRSLPVPNAGAVAWSDDNTRLAVGSDDGRIQIYSANGDVLGSTTIELAVRSIGYNAGGFFLATGGDRVFRIEGDGRAGEQITRATGSTPDCVACSSDGSLFALRLDPTTVVVLTYPAKDTAATIQYLDRRATGVAFGPPPYFGIGLDTGDGNKINLRTKAVHRTDTHPGRTHNRWALSVAIDPALLPRSFAAKENEGNLQAPAAPLAGADEARKGGLSLQVIIGAILLAIGLIILISRY